MKTLGYLASGMTAASITLLIVQFVFFGKVDGYFLALAALSVALLLVNLPEEVDVTPDADN